MHATGAWLAQYAIDHATLETLFQKNPKSIENLIATMTSYCDIDSLYAYVSTIQGATTFDDEGEGEGEGEGDDDGDGFDERGGWVGDAAAPERRRSVEFVEPIG